MCGGMFSGKQQRLQMIADATKEQEAAAKAAAADATAQSSSSGSAAQPAGGAQAAPGVVVKGVASSNYAGEGTKNARISASDVDTGYSDINKRRKRKSALSGLGL